MKRHLTLLCLFGIICSVSAQAPQKLSIEECYTLARQNYPLVKQQELINKSRDFSIENISKGYLPQVGIYGQASYQSAVTEIPIKIPNVNIPGLSKDQYRLYAEVTQTIYDGGIIKAQKAATEANAIVESQKVEVELKKINDRINQLFFGILMADEQISQVEILKKDIQIGIDKTKAAINNGVGLKSNAESLEAEMLKAGQRTTELKALKQGLLDMLALFINKTLDNSTTLEIPAALSISNNINRSELALYDQQKNFITVQNKLLYSKNLPKFGLFLQAGVGRPALNMLTNEFSSYYIAGLRLNWSLSGFYTYRNEKAILENNTGGIELQKETFLLNTNFIIKQQNAEIAKLRELIESDEAIYALRDKVKNTSMIQLENGVISSNDYLREINAADQARQNQMLHQIQLTMAIYNLKWTTEN